MTQYEVEIKSPITDVTAFTTLLEEIGAEPLGIREEIDVYFSHPARDFAQTDEALRVRKIGQDVSLTYKGPKIDAHSKTRREIDLPLTGDQPDRQAVALFEALGFRPVREVRKERRLFRLNWEGYPVLLSIDIVQGLGAYTELETHVSEDEVERARDAILRLAGALRLSQVERRSYLELLLDRERT